MCDDSGSLHAFLPRWEGGIEYMLRYNIYILHTGADLEEMTHEH